MLIAKGTILPKLNKWQQYSVDGADCLEVDRGDGSFLLFHCID
jgi:hypothetical protein